MRCCWLNVGMSGEELGDKRKYKLCISALSDGVAHCRSSGMNDASRVIAVVINEASQNFNREDDNFGEHVLLLPLNLLVT